MNQYLQVCQQHNLYSDHDFSLSLILSHSLSHNCCFDIEGDDVNGWAEWVGGGGAGRGSVAGGWSDGADRCVNDNGGELMVTWF